MTGTVTRIPVEERSAELSMRDLVAPLFRHKALLLIVFLSVMGIVILLAAISGPSYASHMSILVDRERLDPLVTTEATTQMITTSTPVTPEEINSEVELLSSRDVLEQVVRLNHLDQPKPGFSLGKLLHPYRTQEDRTALAVRKLATDLKIEATIKTNLITVTYKSPNPQLSYSVLNDLGRLYTAKHVAVHRPAGSYQFFAQESQQYHDALEAAEQKLRNFGRQNNVSAPDLQRTDLALQVATSVGIQHMAEQAIATDEERLRSDAAQMKQTPNRSATQQASTVPDRLLEDLNSALLAAQTKRTQLTLKYDPSFPLVREADDEIAQYKAAIANAQKTRYLSETTDRDPTFELLREDMARTQEDLAGQRANLAATKRSIESIQSQMVSLDAQALTQQDLLREFRAAESNYLLYLSKKEQERTTDALDTTRIANVAIAVPPAVPVLPLYGWGVIIVVAFFAGAVVSIAAVYVVNYLDSSFQTPAQVIEFLGIPVVVAVSKKTA